MKQRILILTLDFINDIAHADGKIARSAQRIKDNHTIDNANRVLAWARKHDLLIAHVKVAFDTNYLACPKSSPMFSRAPEFGALKLGDWGGEFLDTLDVQADDYVIVKNRVSAFYNTKLESLLRANNIDTLMITGTATNMAVEATAREAHDRDYHVVVVKDACETSDDVGQIASLNVMERFAKIIDSHSLDELFK